MKKGTIVTGTIIERRFPDKGILPLEEGLCIVKNTLPGQEIEARIIKTKKGKMEAKLLRVLQPAPTETVPSCPVWGECGGCSSLTLPYEEECRMKERQVRGLLREAISSYENLSNQEAVFAEPSNSLSTWASLSADPPLSALKWFEGLHPSPVELGYRNKMEFSFGNSEKDGPLTLGMHRRGSYYDILNAGNCVIVDGDFRRIVRATVEYVPYKQSVENLQDQTIVESEVPGKITANVTLKADCTDDGTKIATTSGFTLAVGTSMSVLGPGYSGSGYLISMDRSENG